jgi:hypothetical protein
MVRFVSPLPLIVAVSAFIAQSVEADQVQGEPLYARLANMSFQSQLRGTKDAEAKGLGQAMHADDLDHLDAHQTTEDSQKQSDGAGENGSQEVTCSCTTPRAGTTDHNQYTCTDGDLKYCATDQTCNVLGSFVKGDVQDACQALPTPAPQYQNGKKVCAANVLVGTGGTHWCSGTPTNPVPEGYIWVDPLYEKETFNGCCGLGAGKCAHCYEIPDVTCVLRDVGDNCSTAEGAQLLRKDTIFITGRGPARKRDVCCKT